LQQNMASISEVTLSIDGHAVKADAGSQLLEAVLKVSEIPHICYYSELVGTIRRCDICPSRLTGDLFALARRRSRRAWM
jgi:formate dehydrogenase major subunit